MFEVRIGIKKKKRTTEKYAAKKEFRREKSA